jgi:hypothetical protein
LGESKIKIVTVIGTELTATATAIGISPPSACHIVPDPSPSVLARRPRYRT